MAVLIKLCQKLFFVRETNKQYGVIKKYNSLLSQLFSHSGEHPEQCTLAHKSAQP